MDNTIVYYAFFTHDGKTKVICEPLNPFLMMADYVYYWALSYDDAYISIVSTIRRSGAIVPFLYGAFALKEKNIKIKSVLLCGVILGVSLLYIFR